jgi:hypothetical protein
MKNFPTSDKQKGLPRENYRLIIPSGMPRDM